MTKDEKKIQTKNAESELQHYGLADEPAEEDFLGCEKYFKGLADFIKECPTPMTIAIQGGWGTGKTSAMQIVKKQLESSKEGKIFTIDFNTWQYAKTTSKALFVPLLYNLIDKIDKEGKANCENYTEIHEEVNKILKGFLGVASKAAEGAIGGLNEVAGGALKGLRDAIKPVGQAQEEQKLSDYFESLNELHKSLQKKINTIADPANNKDKSLTGRNRIVVFVDDLDRLNPEVAVELLEDMKNIMSFRDCVFVLALDHEIVRRGIKKKYGEDMGEYAERFFDKIIQVPFSLPTSRYDIDNYLKRLDMPILKEWEEERSKIKEILENYGDTNPRTIKRALNILQLYMNVDKNAYEKNIVELFAVLLLQMNHKNMYDELVKALKADRNRCELWNWTFAQKNCSCTETDKWFEQCDEEEKDIKEVLKTVFSINQYGYVRLYDMVMETSLTGEGGSNKQLQAKEVEELLRSYMKEIFGAKYEKTDKGVVFQYKEIRLRISMPSNNKDHVNLNVINAGDFTQVTETENEAYLKQKLKEHHYDFMVNSKNSGGSKMDILYSDKKNGESDCCFRNITLEQYDAIHFVGETLRNLKERGCVFSDEVSENAVTAKKID